MEGGFHAGGKWKGRKITPRSPVVNVTFWDAWAYASWKPVAPGEPRYRLPERGEWMALGNMLETGEKGDRTLVIDRYSNDHDLKTGVCGMASGVMEWTSSMEKDPARVKEPPGPVACGGDWRRPASPTGWNTCAPAAKDGTTWDSESCGMPADPFNDNT